MASRSFGEFEGLLGFVDQLVEIHGKLQTGRGRRHEQDAIHRAGVVLTVAAWQAYVEKVLEEALDAMSAEIIDPAANPPAPNWARHAFSVRRAAIKINIKKFNTPNDINVRDLFLNSLEFNPWPHWEWSSGMRNWNPNKTRKVTNDWIKIRHTIVHGYDLPNDIEWIRGVNRKTRLILGILNRCKRHFRYIALKTDDAFCDHLKSHHNMANPW